MTQPQPRPALIASDDLLALLPEPLLESFEVLRLYNASREMLAQQVRQTLESVLMLALQGGPDAFLTALESALGLQSSVVLDGEGEEHTVTWVGEAIGDHSHALLDQCRGYGAGSMAMISYNGDDVPQAGVLVYDDPEMLGEILRAINLIKAASPDDERCSHSQNSDPRQVT